MKAKQVIHVQLEPEEAEAILEELKKSWEGNEDWAEAYPFLADLRDKLIEALDE